VCAQGDENVPDQWTAIVAAPKWSGGAHPPLVLLGLQADPNYVFQYQARTLDPATGATSAAMAISAGQQTYVNFFFATQVSFTTVRDLC
jgi:hypothetical protein